jgi:DNA-binding IclR family transcriptional regulator
MSAEEGGVASVDRAFAVIQVVLATGSASLSDIADQTGFYKSTILRLLQSLMRAGAVVQQEDSAYTLGPLAFLIANRVDPNSMHRERLLKLLQTLVERCDESASFHIWHSPAQRYCVYRLDANHSVLDNIKAGMTLPLDKGAAGHVIAQHHEMPNQRGKTQESSAPVVSIGERDGTCAAVAAPVYGSHGIFLGAASISGPKERFSKERIAAISRVLAQETRKF